MVPYSQIFQWPPLHGLTQRIIPASLSCLIIFSTPDRDNSVTCISREVVVQGLVRKISEIFSLPVSLLPASDMVLSPLAFEVTST